jgi:hypothetical protein
VLPETGEVDALAADCPPTGEAGQDVGETGRGSGADGVDTFGLCHHTFLSMMLTEEKIKRLDEYVGSCEINQTNDDDVIHQEM